MAIMLGKSPVRVAVATESMASEAPELNWPLNARKDCDKSARNVIDPRPSHE